MLSFRHSALLLVALLYGTLFTQESMATARLKHSHHATSTSSIADPLAIHLHEIEDAHYKAEWAEDPVSATLSGIHTGDDRLPDLSDAATQKKLERLTREDRALQQLDLSAAPLREQDDRIILRNTIQKERFTLEELQPDRHQPDFALSIVTNSLDGLISQNYAPLETRMQAAIQRLAHIPAFLHIATRRLNHVPAIYIDIALDNLTGALSFCQTDLPTAFAAVKNPALQDAFQRENHAAIIALAHYRDVLHHITPEGSFALGRKKMTDMLASDMIDLSPEAIIKAGEAQLERDVTAFRQTAEHLNPNHPDDAFLAVRKDHPTASELIPTIQVQLHEAQTFIIAHHIVYLPTMALPIVRDTPPFEQSLITAATEWAGAFEPHRLPSYYDITPPPPHASAMEAETILSDFNRSALLNITVHEALPGHFVQGLYLQSNPQWSSIRKDASSYSTTEGWAHYTEQMMIEEGFQKDNSAYHLMQLQDALLRDCRLLASFGMHTQGMTLSEAEELLSNRCLQSSASAHKEARRGAADPGYFSYTLGKLIILHLREDIKKQQGTHFSLEQFHNDFLKAGLVPLRIIRRELTGKDGPLL